MKKWLVVLMTVLALCLMCSGAMAATTWDLSTLTPDAYGITIYPNDGDTITGVSTCDVTLYCSGIGLTFRDVEINGSLNIDDMYLDSPPAVTITLDGDNKVNCQSWSSALGVFGSLIIDGTGSLTLESAKYSGLSLWDMDGNGTFTLLNGTVTAIGSFVEEAYGIEADKPIAVKGGTLIAAGRDYACANYGDVTDYIPAAVQFNASTHEMTAGTNAISAVATSAYNGEKYMKIAPKANAGGGDPVPQPGAPTAPTAPKTGDESNLALWACLMTLSAIGLVVVGKKFKKAF